MPARLRVTYQFLVDDAAYADPFNPVGAGGDRSIAATPDAPAQPHWPVIGADDVLPLPRTRIRWSERTARRTAHRASPPGGRRWTGGPAARRGRLAVPAPGHDRVRLGLRRRRDAPVTLVFLPAKDRQAEFGAGPSCGRRSGTSSAAGRRSPAYPPTWTGWWSPGRASAG